MTGNVLDRTENQQDRRPYYCTWSRATAYYFGVLVGVGLGAVIVFLTRTDPDPFWMWISFLALMVFSAACVIYYDLMRRSEKVEEKVTEKEE